MLILIIFHKLSFDIQIKTLSHLFTFGAQSKNIINLMTGKTKNFSTHLYVHIHIFVKFDIQRNQIDISPIE